jgi:putative sterol carrier protein
MPEAIDGSDAIANLQEVDPDDFVELVARSSEDELSAIVNGPHRKRILDEIFNRMADHVEPEKVRGTDAVVHFKILDRPDELGGGYDHYEVVFEDGSCRASDEPERDPQVTIRIGAAQFLKLASNQASGPTLFLTGKLRLEGDVMLASRLTSFFRIPSAG